MNDKQIKLIESVVDSMVEKGVTLHDVLTVAAMLIAEAWNQCGADLNNIESPIGRVNDNTRKGIHTFLEITQGEN